jgi:hypothetical protein
MTEAKWLTSDDPTAMLRALPTDASARKLRLFTAVCCRRVQHTTRNPDLADAGFYIEALERVADGAMTATEWSEVVARLAQLRHDVIDRTLDVLTADFCTFLTALDDPPAEGALWALVNANIALGNFRRRPEAHEVGGSPEAKVQAPLLRDIYGNPFRPVTFSPEWRTDTTLTLARQMYDSREFSAMPILADALQDAGCDHEDVLTHCRGEGPHVRGCWVVDLVLGRE